jgi:hypothetical protein
LSGGGVAAFEMVDCEVTAGGRESEGGGVEVESDAVELLSLVSLQPCKSMPPMTTTWTARIIKTLKKKVDFPFTGSVPWGTSGFGVFIRCSVNSF